MSNEIGRIRRTLPALAAFRRAEKMFRIMFGEFILVHSALANETLPHKRTLFAASLLDLDFNGRTR